MKRILICNRGEIAIRVAKAVRELGHIAVGFWTDNELEPPHLEYCDEWVHLPGLNNSETYLNMDSILNLIQKNKIDAVHPGYGFLSENTVFAKKLEDMGVIFIGPNSYAIEKMGDKAISKQMAKDAGVPVIIGSKGVEKIDEFEDGFKIKTNRSEYTAKAVVLGPGKVPNMLGLENESKYYNKGIHYCTKCDAPFYQGKTTASIGVGAYLLESGMLLSRMASKVYRSTAYHNRRFFWC